MSVNRILSTSILSATATLTLAAQGTILTNVPMQGIMVHIGVLYHAEHQELHAHIDPAVPQLTPLEISHPGSTLQGSDPWFASLDPSRGNLAFNRQFGFVMAAESDPLPTGTTIRIRQLSATPGLQVFRYRGTEPKLWEPIFGTAGSPSTLAWNLMMFHPAYVAPTGTLSQQAEYELSLVDASTGEPIAGETPGYATLQWTVAASLEPKLEIAQRLLLSWTTTATNRVVESSDRLEGGTWIQVTNTPFTLDGKLRVLLAPESGPRYFRLRPTP